MSIERSSILVEAGMARMLEKNTLESTAKDSEKPLILMTFCS